MFCFVISKGGFNTWIIKLSVRSVSSQCRPVSKNEECFSSHTQPCECEYSHSACPSLLFAGKAAQELFPVRG